MRIYASAGKTRLDQNSDLANKGRPRAAFYIWGRLLDLYPEGRGFLKAPHRRCQAALVAWPLSG